MKQYIIKIEHKTTPFLWSMVYMIISMGLSYILFKFGIFAFEFLNNLDKVKHNPQSQPVLLCAIGFLATVIMVFEMWAKTFKSFKESDDLKYMGIKPTKEMEFTAEKIIEIKEYKIEKEKIKPIKYKTIWKAR